MHKLLLVAVVALAFFISCSRDNPNSPNNPTSTPTFKFSANGKNYEVSGSWEESNTNGVLIYKDYSSSGRYFLKAKNTQSNSFEVKWDFTTTNFVTGTYQPNSHPNFLAFWLTEFPGVEYHHQTGIGSTFSVVITKYQNGLADGTFSGSDMPKAGQNTNAPSKIQVTNGEFKNVRVVN